MGLPSSTGSSGSIASVVRLVAIAISVVLGGLESEAGRQRSDPAGGPLAFDVSSVRPSQNERGGFRFQGLTLAATGVTVENMIAFAYQSPPYLVVGGPAWMRLERFEIVAKMPDADRAMSILDHRERAFPMMQHLLAERFALRVREETRMLPRYVLRAMEPQRDSPPGLRRPNPACEEVRTAVLRGEREVGEPPSPAELADPAGQPCRIWFRHDSELFTLMAGATSMEGLVRELGTLLGRHIEDETGIAGLFGLELKIGIDHSRLAALPSDPGRPPRGPSIAQALANDLNIVLREEVGPVPVVVVERVERPTPN